MEHDLNPFHAGTPLKSRICTADFSFAGPVSLFKHPSLFWITLRDRCKEISDILN
jgi:hypothetical protein